MSVTIVIIMARGSATTEYSSSPSALIRGSYLVPVASVSVIVLLLFAQSNLTKYETNLLAKEAESSLYYDFTPHSDSSSNHSAIPNTNLFTTTSTSRKDPKEIPPPTPPTPSLSLKEVEDGIMKEIINLSHRGESQRGKRYRSLVCALSRNDIHLREYVVRNLLAGFSHIVIYDNNQVGGIGHGERCIHHIYLPSTILRQKNNAIIL